MGIHEENPQNRANTDSQAARMSLSAALRPVIGEFLETLNYSTPPDKDYEELKTAMLRFAESSGVPYKGDKHAHQCFVTGLSVAKVSEISASLVIRKK